MVLADASGTVTTNCVQETIRVSVLFAIILRANITHSGTQRSIVHSKSTGLVSTEHLSNNLQCQVRVHISALPLTNNFISDDCFAALGTRNTVCLGVGWCTVPCNTDADCLTGRCDVVQGDKTCFLYDPYERNDTISALSNALLIDVSCTSDTMASSLTVNSA